jgi:uncharacterized protein (DUF2249 family)
MPSPSPHLIDVRPVRSERVPVTVRAAVEALGVGDSIVLIHDRNVAPIPSLLGDASDSVNWQRLRDGPEVWAIRITRRSATDA